MEILLTKNLNNLGEFSNIVNVKNGYAKNFLLPKNYAVIATKKNIKNIKFKNIKQEIIEKQNNINNISIMLGVKTKNNDEIYGSINSKNLSKIFKKLNLKVNSKCIEKNVSIKKIGKYKIEIVDNKNNNLTIIYIILLKINK